MLLIARMEERYAYVLDEVRQLLSGSNHCFPERGSVHIARA